MNERSVDAVAVGAARAISSSDTTVDANQEHTAVRAALAGWLTPRYARAQVRSAIAGPAGAEWTTWMRHRAYVVVTARLSGDDHPPDSRTLAVRKVLITEQAIGRDGWRGRPFTEVVAITLMRINWLWRVASDQTS